MSGQNGATYAGIQPACAPPRSRPRVFERGATDPRGPPPRGSKATILMEGTRTRSPKHPAVGPPDPIRGGLGLAACRPRTRSCWRAARAGLTPRSADAGVPCFARPLHRDRRAIGPRPLTIEREQSSRSAIVPPAPPLRAGPHVSWFRGVDPPRSDRAPKREGAACRRRRATSRSRIREGPDDDEVGAPLPRSSARARAGRGEARVGSRNRGRARQRWPAVRRTHHARLRRGAAAASRRHRGNIAM